MGYIGRDNSLDTFTKQSITANGGTSFTLDQGVGDSSSILVSIGGIVQQPDVAYTASGTALTFTSAPTNAYPIWVVYLGKELTVSTDSKVDDVDTQAGVGDGTATPITLVNSVSSVNDIIVTLNGIAQKPSTDYTVSGTTLTFTTAPSSAMNILVYYLSLSVADNTPANYSVSTASQFVSSGTWPAWNGSNLTGAGGDATQADIDALIASLATLSFLQNIDQSTALLNMVNGWSDTLTAETSVDSGSVITHYLTHFDGFTDFLECSTSGLGAVDGKNFIISFYMKAEMADGAQKTIMTTTNNRLQVYRSTDNKLGLVLENPSATEIAHIKSTRTITKSDGVVHCLIAIDMANTTVQMSINGAAVETNVVLTAVANDNIDFTDGTLRIGNRAGTVYFEGALGQIYLTQEYLDISNSTNRQKFYNDGLVDFSSNGSTPTGNQPRIYLNNSASTLFTNHGSGGNFTPNGLGGGVFVDGGYINDKLYSSNSFTNSYEVIEYNSKGNHNGSDFRGLGEANNSRAGQAITLASATVVTKVAFLIKEEAAATGNLYAEIQGVTGTVGSSAVGNDTIYALSNAVDSANIGTNAKMVEFTFANPVVLAAGNYWFGVNATSMSGSGGTIKGRIGRSTSTHAGNGAVHDNSSWAAPGSGTDDYIFYLYGNTNLDLKTKGTNALATVDSPASAPTKGHIEALVDDRIIDPSAANVDSSSGGHTGTLQADATFSTTQKKFGTHSLYCDGTGDGLLLPNHADYNSIGTGNYTLELWCYPTATNASHDYMIGTTSWDASNNFSWFLGMTGDSPSGTSRGFQWSQYNGSGGASNNPSLLTNSDGGSATFAINTWHHVAVVRSGNTTKLYVNGQDKGYSALGTPLTGNPNLGGTGGVQIGGGHGYNWEGYIDEVRLSNTARYSSNFTPSATAFTSDANTKLLMHMEEAVTYPTLNTHVVGEMSRDGGSTYSPATLARSSTGIDGATTEIISGDVDFTGDPSGTNVVGRIRTVNKHKVTVDGISVNWS